MAAVLLLLLPVPQGAAAPLSLLAPLPPWPRLERYQNSLSLEEFRARLWLYSPDGTFYNYLGFENGAVQVYDTAQKQTRLWELRLSTGADPQTLPSPEKSPLLRQQLGATAEKPLCGLRICLDPGHIGGEWSDVEERKFTIGRDRPVEEAELNCITCRWIGKQLEAAGAEVVWSRQLGVPATALRPADLQMEGILALWERDSRKAQNLGPAGLVKLAQWWSELLFYRVAEIQARATTVASLQPDLTLCVHYNAAPGGFRGARLYSNVNRIVIFVHGSYLPRELEFADIKYDLMAKLLEGSAPVEEGVGNAIAGQVVKTWNYPPEDYEGGREGCRRVNANPYVWSRNLLASRLFPGPVVFVEGPYMNDRQMYRRLQAGDYDGEREIEGKKCRSIYREYADIVAQGVIDYYRNSLGEK